MPINIGNLSEEQLIEAAKEMLRVNEAGPNEEKKYQLSDARAGKSGHSFGLCQHDCSTKNSPGRNFIKKLLEQEDKSAAEIKNIISILADHTKRLSGESLKIVNQVLTKNKAAIDEFDQEHIVSSVKHAYRRVSLLSGDLGSKVRTSILSDPRAFLQLVDYHNQLDFTPHGKLEKFLGGKNKLDDKLIDISEPSLLPEIRRFIFGTKWGKSEKGARDCARRQGNIDRLILPSVNRTLGSIVKTVKPPASKRSLNPRSYTHNTPALLTEKQLNYLNDIRERAFSMANTINGIFGDELKIQAMKIGIDVHGNPITSIMSMMKAGIKEFKNLESKVFVSDFRNFTKQGYRLLSDLSVNMSNIADCATLGSRSLGFSQEKLAELAEPFLKTAERYHTAADSLLSIHEFLNKEGMGDLQQSISKFNSNNFTASSELTNKINIASDRLNDAEDNLRYFSDFFGNAEESYRVWSQVFNEASTAINDKTTYPEEFTKSGTSPTELRSNKKNKSLLQTINTLEYGVQLFGSVMQAIDKPEIASSVLAVAVPALNITSILCTWGEITAASGPAAPYVALAGAVVMLGMGIASLFKNPDGPTRDEIIMRQFERLSLQIDIRFDRIEKFIGDLAQHIDMGLADIQQLFIRSHQIMLDAITNLHNDTNKGIATLLDRIFDLQKSLDNITQRQQALFTEAYMKEFRQLLLFSHQVSAEILGQGLNPNSELSRHKYIEFYNKYHSFLLKDSKSETLAGSRNLAEGKENHGLVQVLKNACNPDKSLDYESSINTIAEYVEKIDDEISNDTLVNPLLWSEAVIGFVKFITNTPEFLYGDKTLDESQKKGQYTALKEMINHGSAVTNFLLNSQKSSVFWQKIISNYTNALRDFLVELYSIHWPLTAEALSFTESPEATLAHVAALKMLDTGLEDYIQGRAGPAATDNLFHKTIAVPEELTTRFPNPNKEIFPRLYVHNLRAGDVRFHAAPHMRSVGREMLRAFAGVPAPDESNGACEDAVKNMHRDLHREVNRLRDDPTPGETIEYKFVANTKQKITGHQEKWTSLMSQLRNIPTQLRSSHGEADRYIAALLRYSSGKMAHIAHDRNAVLPDRAIIKKAYEIHQNAASLPLSPTNDALLRKLEALDDCAYLIKFFVSLLFPTHIEFFAYFRQMLWDKDRIIAYNSSEPLTIKLHNLLEREHPRLPTYLENFQTEILLQVEALESEDKQEDQLQYIQPNIWHALKVLKQFKLLYFREYECLYKFEDTFNFAKKEEKPEENPNIKIIVPDSAKIRFPSPQHGTAGSSAPFSSSSTLSSRPIVPTAELKITATPQSSSLSQEAERTHLPSSMITRERQAATPNIATRSSSPTLSGASDSLFNSSSAVKGMRDLKPSTEEARHLEEVILPKGWLNE